MLRRESLEQDIAVIPPLRQTMYLLFFKNRFLKQQKIGLWMLLSKVVLFSKFETQ